VKRYRQISAFILAGGASSRMGQDKALLDFGGVPLILRTARLLEPLVAGVTLVGSPRRYAALGLSGIEDNAYPHEASDNAGCGPLAGIATALATTNSIWNLIVACDLPYLSEEWIDWLLSRALRSRGEAVVPRTGHGMEPLAAVYRRECAAPVAAALARGARKVSDVIEDLRADFVYPADWSLIDRSGLMLRNMNSPQDYDEARKWWTSHRSCDEKQIRKRSRQPGQKRRSVPRRRK
jgi:molybdopterin-guanine dinucleotide biosynthesis protein A